MSYEYANRVKGDHFECSFTSPDNYSETSKYRDLTAKYCAGCGIDIASQGSPVVPWAWQIDLPQEEYALYNGGAPIHGPVQLRGHGESLPVDSNSLDFVYASHILEDFAEWNPPIGEWVRVLKPGGNLIILIPDRELWIAQMARGQAGNPAHKHEGRVGELTEYAAGFPLEVIEDRLTNCFENDYTILFVARKK
jgi:SAM-dependent methyltransferase